MSDSDSKQAALCAIQEEAEKLLGLPIEGKVRDTLERIISIARYQIDVRSIVEEKNAQS